MKPVVFAGPSIVGLSKAILDHVDLRPPAATGDVLGAVIGGAKAIGLIDGIFDGGSSVWHKEILAALYRGVRVLGSSSMGALRAAECHRYGMSGIGRIFEDYRDGIRTADSDVAILHAPPELGFYPITLALVDAEVTLLEIRRQNVVDQDVITALATTARAMSFRERSWPEIVARISDKSDEAHHLLNVIAKHEISQKRDDAAELITAITCKRLPRMHRARLVEESFNQTDLFVSLYHRVSCGKNLPKI